MIRYLQVVFTWMVLYVMPIPRAYAQPISITHGFDCASATELSGNQTYSYSSRVKGGPACLWFRMCLEETPGNASVSINTLSDSPSQLRAFLLPELSCADLMADWECKGDDVPDNHLRMLTLGELDLSALSVGTYYIACYLAPQNGTVSFDFSNTAFSGCPRECPECLSTFSPLADSLYTITAWVSKEDLEPGTTVITGPYIRVEAPVGTDLQSAPRVGPLIDGWQRMEWDFVMSDGDPEKLIISLGSTDGNALFDDIRVQPEMSAHVSYVYDPLTLRFVAQLDERHFATYYEYDPEGRLIRVKKETERGVMTIQETRENTSKTYSTY